MDSKDVKHLQDRYNHARSAADEVVVEAMIELYSAITGKKPDDRFREKLGDLVQFES